MNRRQCRAAAPLIAMFWCAAASCAEIVLTQSAAEKLVVQKLFRNDGRYEVSRAPCAAAFETPSVRLAGGRVSIRAHLSGRVGAVLGGECLGLAVSEWVTVSGRPTPQGGKVRLADIRVDEARPELRSLAQLALQTLGSAIELDVHAAVRRMLQDAAGQGGVAVQTDVEALNIGSIAAADGLLSVTFDFRLVGR